MPPTTKVILLSGQIVSFRMSVAHSLSDILADHQCRHAILNADELRQKWPADNEYRFALYDGLYSVWPAFRAKACHRLILFGETVVTEAQELDGIMEMAHIDDLTEARLAAGGDEGDDGHREMGDVETKGFTLDSMRLTAVKEKPSTISNLSADSAKGGLQVGSLGGLPRVSRYEKGSDTLAAEIFSMFDDLKLNDTVGRSSMDTENTDTSASPGSIISPPSARSKIRPWSTDHYRLEALPMITTGGKSAEEVAMEIFECVRDWILKEER